MIKEKFEKLKREAMAEAEKSPVFDHDKYLPKNYDYYIGLINEFIRKNGYRPDTIKLNVSTNENIKSKGIGFPKLRGELYTSDVNYLYIGDFMGASILVDINNTLPENTILLTDDKMGKTEIIVVN